MLCLLLVAVVEVGEPKEVAVALVVLFIAVLRLCQRNPIQLLLVVEVLLVYQTKVNIVIVIHHLKSGVKILELLIKIQMWMELFTKFKDVLVQFKMDTLALKLKWH